MNYNYSVQKGKVPFIDISGSYSDSSKNNIFNNSKHLLENNNLFFTSFNSGNENDQNSSSPNEYQQKSISDKFNSSDNLISFSIKTNSLEKKKKLFHYFSLSENKKKVNLKIFKKKEKKESNFVYYNKKINNIKENNKLSTPNKNIPNFNYNIINKYKNKVINYDVNYGGKNLMDLFEKISSDSKVDKFRGFSPNQKINNNLIKIKKRFMSKEKKISQKKQLRKHSFLFGKNKRYKINQKIINTINRIKLNKCSRTIKKKLKKNMILYNPYHISYEKTFKDLFQKENNLFIENRYNYKRNVRIYNNNNKERRSNSDDEFKSSYYKIKDNIFIYLFNDYNQKNINKNINNKMTILYRFKKRRENSNQ